MNDIKKVYENSQNLNILYVEDDLNLNQETFDIFEDLFNTVDSALDGKEGFEKYIKFYQDNKSYYDIIITDINMPKLNGIELIKKIQEINQNQEFIVISAHNDSDKLMNLIDLGVNHFILKPISYNKLIDTLFKVSSLLENKKIEEKYHFQQVKNAAMGSMIGNIIHQWKQPLSVISTISSGCSLKLDMDFNIPRDELKNYMDDITESVVRLNNVTNTFKNFLKENKIKTEIVLQEKIEDALVISGTILYDKGIELIKNIDIENEIRINTIGNELIEVIVNIVNNAIDIIEEKDIKDSFIKVELIDKGNSVVITIEDNGGGIPEDVIPNIFDEYFTTKSEDKGTGLGLSMSKKIVTDSLKGDLYVENTENGAKFFIELPI